MVSGSVGTLKAVTLNRIGLKYAAGRRGSARESSMTRRFLLVASAGLMSIAFLAGGGPAPAAAQPSTALTGRVSSAEEGAMEGVVVGARKTGSTVTISVVSDGQGRFSFPSSKLGSGSYSLKVRADGDDVQGPGAGERAGPRPDAGGLPHRQGR